jgi:hypothetical protein
VTDGEYDTTVLYMFQIIYNFFLKSSQLGRVVPDNEISHPY